MPRLFTGLEIPPQIASHLALLRGLAGARWIDPENYHVTLRFIGDIDDPTAREVAASLEAIERPPFDLRIDGLSSFGGRKPRALIATVAHSPELDALQADHERAIRRAGVAPETRNFTPHVTLARLRETSSLDVAEFLTQRGLFTLPPFSAARFVLYSSRASTGGGPYRIEESYPLRA